MADKTYTQAELDEKLAAQRAELEREFAERTADMPAIGYDAAAAERSAAARQKALDEEAKAAEKAKKLG